MTILLDEVAAAMVGPLRRVRSPSWDAILIAAAKAAVADDFGHQDCRQFPCFSHATP